jgi:stage II sporulation protein D
LHGEPQVRIGLQVRVADAAIELQGDYEVQLPGKPVQRLRAGSLRAGVVQGALLLWLPDGNELDSRSDIWLHPLLRESRFHLGDHSYRGSLRLLLVDGAITLINELPLEMYLRGVVPWEIGWRDPTEAAAVEAQAIAARTYSCKRLGQFEEQGFDMLPDVMDQVYRGTTREDSLANAAIRATHGMVVSSRDTLIEAYYSSTCGGHTSRIEEVWDKPAAPYLVGRFDRMTPSGTALCAGSRHFRWTEAWSGAGLDSVLQETLPRELAWPADRRPGRLLDLRTVGRDASGRVRALEIVTTAGTWTVRGDRIRWVLRPDGRAILRSTLFELQVEREVGEVVRVVARGGGNGHGVGLCQMGALEMARRGASAQDILSHYYPQTRVSALY